MFVPIGDSPNFRSTPWATYLLIALNVLIFVATWPLTRTPASFDDPSARAYAEAISQEQGIQVRQISAYDALVFRFGFKPAAPSLADAVTSMFLHGGLLHLLGNMLFLWIYGDNVEHRLGRFAYLMAYLGTGFAAALGDGLLRMGSAIPSVGASGAISGVLGFYFIWFPKNRVRVWIFLFPIFMDIVELPARLVLGIYLIVDNVLPALISAGNGGVAYGAHLGGFAAAVGLAAVIDRLGLRRPEPAVRRTSVRSASTETNQLAAHLARGDIVGALSSYMSMQAPGVHQSIEPEQPLRLAAGLQDHGHPRAALAVYQRLLTEHPSPVVRAAAHLGAARVLVDELGMPVEAYQHIARALDLDPSPSLKREAEAMLDKLQRRGVLPRAVPLRRR